MKLNSDLEPCSNCGNTKLYVDSARDVSGWLGWVECPKCKQTIYSDFIPDSKKYALDEAIIRWNTSYINHKSVFYGALQDAE